LVALLVVVVVMVARRGAPTQAVPEDGAASTAMAGTTDLTQMSPKEQADRLFDRVMRESEAGQADSVKMFAPMAVQAHEMLGSAIDADGRLHLGLIHLAVDPDYPFFVDAESDIGAVRSDLPPRRAGGAPNGTGPKVRLRTHTGAIRLTRA